MELVDAVTNEEIGVLDFCNDIRERLGWVPREHLVKGEPNNCNDCVICSTVGSKKHQGNDTIWTMISDVGEKRGELPTITVKNYEGCGPTKLLVSLAIPLGVATWMRRFDKNLLPEFIGLDYWEDYLEATDNTQEEYDAINA